jgi:pyridoxamine 5'-phosphate oxidase
VSIPRKDLPPLVRSELADDPVEQFRSWYALAETEAPLPEAMTLATVDAAGAPNARMVLMKGFGPDGVRFHSNYESVKGSELAANPRAALVIYWRELDRQVRVRGEVSRLTPADSDEYFRTRPPGGQVAASISPQSRPIEREELDRRFAEQSERFEGSAVPRPEHWGGYLVALAEVEFWQGREDRMHDRFRYTRDGGGWRIERLAP